MWCNQKHCTVLNYFSIHYKGKERCTLAQTKHMLPVKTDWKWEIPITFSRGKEGIYLCFNCFSENSKWVDVCWRQTFLSPCFLFVSVSSQTTFVTFPKQRKGHAGAFCKSNLQDKSHLSTCPYALQSRWECDFSITSWTSHSWLLQNPN